MKSNLFSALYLKPAMQEPGCPICTLQNLSETQYLENLLHEYVNDYQAQAHFIASLGYCPQHAWQMAEMEIEKFGDGLGNSLIYENLVNSAYKTLSDYKKSTENSKKPYDAPSGFFRWIKKSPDNPPGNIKDPFNSHNQNICRVCQVGKSAETSYLGWLLENLADPEPEFRELYTRSDGLCMNHFRRALAIQTPAVSSSIVFLMDHILENLSVLSRDLHNYIHSFDITRKASIGIPDGQASWLKTVRLFAGNEQDHLTGKFKKYHPGNQDNFTDRLAGLNIRMPDETE